MVRFLFLQFEPDDGPGRIGAGLRALNVQCEVVRLYAGAVLPSLDQYDGLVALGGAMNAEDDAHYPYLPACVAILQEAHRRDLLTLGVCLGGQLLARSRGVKIYRKEKTEIGFFAIELTEAGRADPLFEGLPDPLLTFQWHEDAFTLPEGATALADSTRDSLQAFRSGRTYGIQFHPEVEPWMLRAWATGGGAALPEAAEPTTAEALRRRFAEVEETFTAQTTQLCRNLAALARLEPAFR